MGAKLLYRDAQGVDRSADVPPEGGFLGRAIDCIVRTDDAMVSRKNCKISLLGGRWYVEDLTSANGTFINERRIQKEALKHGDVIRCGSLQVRFVEVLDQAAQAPSRQSQGARAPSRQSQGVPSSAPSDSTGHIPAIQVKEIVGAPPQEALNRPTQAAPVVDVGAGAAKTEEAQKALVERDAAQAAATEAKQQLEQTVAKLDAAEQEGKRLRSDLLQAKEALDKLRRQSKHTEEELSAQQSVNEQLRQEVKGLREEVGKTRGEVEDLRAKLDGKERQLSAANDDVRRAKQAADSLSMQLQKVTKERDEQVRAMNEKTGDADHLREILKERERMLEERRVGLINLETQAKEARARADGLEKELIQTRGERDGLRDRLQRTQCQVEDLRAELDRLGGALTSQRDGGEPLVALSKENSELRTELGTLKTEYRAMEEKVEKAEMELAQVEKLRAQINQLTEEKKASDRRAQGLVEQAVQKAVVEVRAELAALTEERDRLRDRLTNAEQRLQEALSRPAPQAAPGGQGGDEAAQLLSDLKGLATTAYDGINDALSELRLSIVMAQETFEKVERAISDKDLAGRVRDAIEQSMERAEEAKAQIRTLRSVID